MANQADISNSFQFMNLTTTNHDRDKVGLTYVYPVLSRRSGGLSIGINLNPNNACNWQCIYCQVPNLVRGSAPEINFIQLEKELHGFLTDVTRGDFYDRESVPADLRVICDIAISGNGEPTMTGNLVRVVEIIKTVINDFKLNRKIKVVLISNGSMMNKKMVQDGIREISNLGGEVWFKIDSVTTAGIEKINQVQGSMSSTLKKLKSSSELCSTWIQTCVFALDGKAPSEKETSAYLDFVMQIKLKNIPVKGVLLYGIARPSMQADADRLSSLPEEWLKDFARKINQCGIEVKISP